MSEFVRNTRDESNNLHISTRYKNVREKGSYEEVSRKECIP